MPANNVSIIEVYRTLSAVAAATFSTQDTGVFLKLVPAGVPGMILTLPAEPSDGDRYFFADVDGSVSISHVLEVKPDPGGSATIDGASVAAYFQSKVSGWFVFDGDANNWVPVLSGTAAFETGANQITTASTGAPATLGDLTSGTATPIILFAIGMKPKSTGNVQLDINLVYTLSAADTVTMAVGTQNNCSSIAGGTQVFASPQLNVESGQGAGQPVVVTASGGLVNVGNFESEVATAQITKQTAVFSGLVTLAEPTTAGDVTAIVVTIAAAGGAHITGMTALISAREV